MHRKKLIAGLVAVLALALAAVAGAVQMQSADITFSSKKAGSATKIRSIFKVSDPANTTPGQEGKPTNHIERVDIQFPRDMKFNDGAYPQCKLSSTGALKGGACKSSIIGRGTTKVDARGVLGLLTAKLTAYNSKRGLKILVVIKENSQVDQVLQPKLTRTNTLVTVLPAILQQTRSELTDFDLTINPKPGRLKVRGKFRRTPYAVLPKKCPKGGKFVIKTKYYFAKGGTYTTPGTQNGCRR